MQSVATLGVIGTVLVASSKPAHAAIVATATTTSDPGLVALHRTAATAGFLAYALMVGTVCWGILTTTHIARRGIRRQTLYGGHMTMAIMTMSFIAIHIAGNLFNPTNSLHALNAVVPFFPGSSLGVTFGVVSGELSMAIIVSVWLQQRLGYRTWHVIHRLAYPAYCLALGHTIVSGSDVHQQLIVVGLAASCLSVVALFVLRAMPSTSLVRRRLSPAEF
jgi:DMSO/TMAO reductase YedYZ heme-binding membrane subunit